MVTRDNVNLTKIHKQALQDVVLSRVAACCEVSGDQYSVGHSASLPKLTKDGSQSFGI
jgi:hypothetical protein